MFVRHAAFALLVGACTRTSDAPLSNAPIWSVDSLPELAISGDGPDSLNTVGDVAGAARLSDGGVVVGDRANATLKFFDAHGRFIRNIGNKGSGPGEFQNFIDVQRCGEALYIRDNASAFSVFSLKGKFLRTVAIESPSPTLRPFRFACNAAGQFISASFGRMIESPVRSAMQRSDVPYWISGADGKPAATLGTLAGTERWVAVSESTIENIPMPMGHAVLVAIGSTRAYVGTADSNYINVFALDGVAQSPLRMTNVELRTTPADIVRFKARELAGLSADGVAALELRWTNFAFPKVKPAYTAFVVDSAENLWVRRYPPAVGDSVNWAVFSVDGLELAQIALPQTFMVFEIGTTSILGAELDLTTGLKTVKVLGFSRPR